MFIPQRQRQEFIYFPSNAMKHTILVIDMEVGNNLQNIKSIVYQRGL